MDKSEQIEKNNDAIKKCLKAHNVTQTELAKAFGIALQSVAKWLQGDMSLTRAQTIASYLNVSLPELLGDTQNEESEIITFQGKRYKITPLDD